MKIVLASVGTRGDMEPFLAIAELLRDRGHQVICAFPEQFRCLAEESRLAFASLGTKFIELLDSPEGKAAMGGQGSGLRRFTALLRLAGKQTDSSKELVNRQYEVINNEQPDRVIYNGKATYAVIWELRHPGRTTFVSPVPYMHYVEGHAHVAFNRNLGPLANRLTFSLAHFGMVTTLMMARRWLGTTEKVSRRRLRNVLKYGRSVYTISPSLFPRPEKWPESLRVLGYHKRTGRQALEPQRALVDFVSQHDKILFVTFGSMTNPNPAEKTRILLTILERHRIPAVLNTASGGLVEPEQYNRELVFFSSGIPYDWILPKVYAVVHHGGSGTTHQALQHGCASMIIPHIIDQFVWSKILSGLGVGPKGMRIGKMTEQDLEPRILDLMGNQQFKTRARQIAAQMAKEDFREELLQALVGQSSVSHSGPVVPG